MMTLRINEAFVSLDGEVNPSGQGCPTVFIRLQGCNLHCSYCDTKASISPSGGQDIGIRELVDVVNRTGPRKVTITGGEPMLQPMGVLSLIRMLRTRDPYMEVSIETNGVTEIPAELCRLHNIGWILDFKEQHFHNPSTIVDNINRLLRYGGKDVFSDPFPIKYPVWIKFVVKDKQSLRESVKTMKDMSLNLSFSPYWGQRSVRFALSPEQPGYTAAYLLDDALALRKEHDRFFFHNPQWVVNVQIHKMIFPQGEKLSILG